MAAPWARADAVHGWLMVLTATLCSSLSCLWCLGCFCFRVMLEPPRLLHAVQLEENCHCFAFGWTSDRAFAP